MTNPTWEELKTYAIVEALEHYIRDLKHNNCNEVAIQLYEKVLKEVDAETNYSVL